MISYDINIYIILQYYYLHSYVCTKVHDKIWIPSFVETGLKTCNDTGGEGFGGSKKFHDTCNLPIKKAYELPAFKVLSSKLRGVD